MKNEFLLDFHLLYKDGEWLVYDVVVDGVSQINSYRGQFARVLRFASYEELIERMREKAKFPSTHEPTRFADGRLVIRPVSERIAMTRRRVFLHLHRRFSLAPLSTRADPSALLYADPVGTYSRPTRLSTLSSCTG